jgi:hypothetical protein
MEGGAFGELRRSLSDGSMVVLPIPALGIFLLEMERRKGSALTEDDVWEALEVAPAIVMTAEHRDKLLELGGFGHLDPDNVWEEWLEFRAVLNEENE